MKVTKQKIDRLADRAGVSADVAKDALERADGDLLEAVILLEKEGRLGSRGTGNGTSWSTSSGVPAMIGVDTDFVILDDVPAPGSGTEKVTGEPVNGSGYARPEAGTGGAQTAGQAAGSVAEPASGQAAGPATEDFVGGPPPGGYYGEQTSRGPGYESAGGQGAAGGPQGGFGGYGKQQQYYYDKKTRTYRYRDESTDFEDGMKSFGRALLRILRASVENHLEVWYRGERLFHFPVILFLLLFVPWIFWTSLLTAVIGLMAGWRYRFTGPHLGRKD
ncbi:hypothetical protein AGMMS49983_05600 [Clostridia bacterium]|nr:hypothetical protein AGMMS49983_05600 [Clostridia bacterium]